MNTKNKKDKSKVKIIVGIIAVIVVLIGSLVIMLNAAKDNNDNEIEISLSNNIEIKNNVNKFETSYKSISTVIPEFKNLEDGYERYINNKITEELNHENVYKDATEGYESGDIGFFTYETDYERYNYKDYLSIVSKQYIHLGDGRPRSQKKCYVIDVATNASPALVDLFNNKIDYKQAIVDEINKQATKNGVELIGGNGLKNISDVQPFYIKDGTLVIYFEASEIAATAVGELEFVMPFEMVDGKFKLPVEYGG